MGKAPADQFYYGDWLRDIELQRSSACTKGVWMQALANMWFANPRGELTESKEELTKLLMVKPEEFDTFLSDVETLGFCYTSRNPNGLITIRNRRMYREEKEREKNRLRQQRYYEKHKPNDAPNGKSDGNLTPPSSSSSSTSKKERNNKRKILIPKDYKLTQEHIDYATSKSITKTIKDIFEAFCVYHRKQGNKYVDWYAAWQTWIRKKIEFDKQNYIAKAQEPGLKAQQERDEIDKQYTAEQLRANKVRLGAIAKGAIKRG